ncbi:hypothetical protein VP01_1977g1 [Puccinia sorghi]|uniref:Uncharacterized protein n=1 Tax=Puccinia sorghi TaxID=27349 RepID=A0A0L6VBN4_9BASI|nr:hypothetical protein VP01_1977g1 [Puccinia sorghi]
MYIFHYFMYICYVLILCTYLLHIVTKYHKECEFGGRLSGRYNTIMQAFGYSGVSLGLTGAVTYIWLTRIYFQGTFQLGNKKLRGVIMLSKSQRNMQFTYPKTMTDVPSAFKLRKHILLLIRNALRTQHTSPTPIETLMKKEGLMISIIQPKNLSLVPEIMMNLSSKGSDLNLLTKSNVSQSLQKKLAQLPEVDIQKLPGSFCCYSYLYPRLIQPSFDAQSLCILHSDCAKKTTYAKRWSLDGSLAGACCIQISGSHLIDLPQFVCGYAYHLLQDLSYVSLYSSSATTLVDRLCKHSGIPQCCASWSAKISHFYVFKPLFHLLTNRKSVSLIKNDSLVSVLRLVQGAGGWHQGKISGITPWCGPLLGQPQCIFVDDEESKIRIGPTTLNRAKSWAGIISKLLFNSSMKSVGMDNLSLAEDKDTLVWSRYSPAVVLRLFQKPQQK